VAPVTAPLPDRFARWPLYSGIAVLAIVCATWLSPASLGVPFLFVLAVPAFTAGVFGAFIAILWCIPAALLKRHWRRALSILALPLMVLLTVPSTEVARWVRDETRFYIHKSAYDAKVTEAKTTGKHTAWVDDWSIFFNANDFVVWDEFDDPEIASGFKLKRRFGGHFYLVGD
jgi:hypothetical protein